MEKDLTKGKEWKVILFFSLPVMGSYLLQILYNITDSIIVGNYIGPDALGAVGLTSSMTWMLVNFCTGLGNGTNIVVSQYFGAGRRTEIEKSIGASILISVAASALLTAACLSLSGFMIDGFLKAPVVMSRQSKTYFNIYSFGLIFQFLYNVSYGILRAHGDSKGSLLFLLASSVMNVVLDCIFVAVLNMGVAGAAAATVIAQATSAFASLVYIRKYFPQLWPGKRFFAGWITEAVITLKMALPIILQTSITAVGFIVLQRLINSFGPASIQGYAAMQKVEQIAYIPCNAFNVAMGSFVGQNIGAGQTGRVEKGYRAAIAMGVGSTTLLAVIVICLANPVLQMFNISGDALLRGREHLYILMVFSFVNGISHITSGFLQGAGDVKVPAASGLVNLSVRVILSYLMAATWIGFRCVYVSLPFAWISACTINCLRYRGGKWKNYKIV